MRGRGESSPPVMGYGVFEEGYGVLEEIKRTKNCL
jgi:hypothetical protein